MIHGEDAAGNEPITWHHGLMARWWAEFMRAEPAELAFYRTAIERFGQPALDLACGAGRLLIPLTEARRLRAADPALDGRTGSG